MGDDEDDDVPSTAASSTVDAKKGGKGAGKGNAKAQAKQPEKRTDIKETNDEGAKNWSTVGLSFQASRFTTFRGVFNEFNFTNWLWYYVVRPKLEDSKSDLEDIEACDVVGVEEVDAVLKEFMP